MNNRSSTNEKESFITEDDQDYSEADNREHSPDDKKYSNSGTSYTGDHYEIKVNGAQEVRNEEDKRPGIALSLS